MPSPTRQTRETPTCRASKECASNSHAANECCAFFFAIPAAASWDCLPPATGRRPTNKSACSTTSRHELGAEFLFLLRWLWEDEYSSRTDRHQSFSAQQFSRHHPAADLASLAPVADEERQTLRAGSNICNEHKPWFLSAPD